ncbi:hypothetical protein C7B64_01970 [Merismopedia glauca CCAP 1448/3]|uniref:Uncharacterized protein n=1 Tax=Merismopedia glauca CCAP 1448/3 TaxID=1296344 RepID=A0A2T1C9F6_9CYAN|nr:hypothetical protein C7B64_01970 [Merismopedia glauca CCAP 1448/3]
MKIYFWLLKDLEFSSNQIYIKFVHCKFTAVFISKEHTALKIRILKAEFLPQFHALRENKIRDSLVKLLFVPPELTA